jgi:hypothetical protein
MYAKKASPSIGKKAGMQKVFFALGVQPWSKHIGVQRRCGIIVEQVCEIKSR